MKSLLILILIILAFGIVGRIDYECALNTQAARQEYARNFANRAQAPGYEDTK